MLDVSLLCWCITIQYSTNLFIHGLNERELNFGPDDSNYYDFSEGSCPPLFRWNPSNRGSASSNFHRCKARRHIVTPDPSWSLNKMIVWRQTRDFTRQTEDPEHIWKSVSERSRLRVFHSENTLFVPSDWYSRRKHISSSEAGDARLVEADCFTQLPSVPL